MLRRSLDHRNHSHFTVALATVREDIFAGVMIAVCGLATQLRKKESVHFFLSSDRFIIPLSFFHINIRDMNSIKVRDEKKEEKGVKG